MSAKPVELIRPDRTRIYASPNGHDLEMHMFFPHSDNSREEAAFPAILFIHGGGFVNGNPSQFFAHAKTASESGFFACSVAYRLSEEACFPAALVDCQNAVRYLRSNSRELNIDPQRIASFGSSAGGYLAAFVGLSDEFRGDGDDNTHSPQVDFVVNVHGPSDMRLGPESEYRTNFMGTSMAEDPDTYRDASPIEYVSTASSPMLLLHDPHDEVVDFKHSKLLFERLKTCNVDAELFELSDTGHGFIYNLHSDQAQKAYVYSESWLKQRMLG